MTEAAGPTPHVGLEVGRAEDLVAIERARGPFVSCVLDATSAVETASHELDVRWRDARRGLEAAGGGPADLEAIDAAVGEGPAGGDTLVAIAAGGRLLLHERFDPAPARELARAAALPALGALIAHRHMELSHIVVMVDKRGAEISVRRPDSPDVERTVEGEAHGVHKVRGGGRHHRKMQQRAENLVGRNIREVAEAVTRWFDEVDPRLVLLGGEEQAVTALRGELPSRVVERARPLEDGGSRSVDGSEQETEAAVVRAVRWAAGEDAAAALAKLAEERGQGDRAAVGPAVIDALARAQVELLLVHDDPDDDRTAFFSPDDPALVATNAADLAAMGVEDPAEGRLVDVAVRGALGTGAAIRVLPQPHPELSEGLAAILRYA
jgi:peptide subunit release factor 1 (eRF1)